MAEGATASGQDHVGMAQVLEECWQAQGVHTTRDDGGGLLHALPLLTVVGAVSLVVLQHEGDVLVGGIALHLAEAHGAGVDARRANDSGDLGVHKGGVAALGLGTGHGSVSGSVVVEELIGEVAAGAGHGGASRDVSIHQERAVLRQRAELGQNVLASGNHLVGIVRGDVGGEQLAVAGLLDGGSHGLHNLMLQRNLLQSSISEAHSCPAAFLFCIAGQQLNRDSAVLSSPSPVLYLYQKA